jgi:branched-chain amino acid transport system substrate-binding protein
MKMKMKRLLVGMACAGLLGAAAFTSAAQAQDKIFVPLFTYRTGAFANSGIPIANGMHDYLTMLNQRDGGIGGVKLDVQECETGYDTKKGVECWESVKDKHPAVVNPFSTGITLQLIPKAAVDKIPVLSMAYGLSASAVGNDFPWIFNPPATYWDGMSQVIRYIGAKEGGLAKLKGKKIGFIYLDVGYGREPIPLLQDLAKAYGFDVKLYPVGVKEMQDQASQWLAVRRDRPNWMVMWGWGAMNPTAVKRASENGYPMDHFIGVWWSGSDDDARGGGMAAKGYLAMNFNGLGSNYPAIQDIKKYVVDKGLSQVKKEDFADNFYNRGVYNSVLIAQAIRNAQKITGKKVVDGTDVRKGLETLNITAADWAKMGFPNFGAPIHVTCADHNGHSAVYMQQWDGKAWHRVSGLIKPMVDKVEPMLKAAAADYVKKNTGWPKRTEACAKLP